MTTVPGGKCTMTFYYHMYGPSIGVLKVYTRTQINGKMTTVWRKRHEVGNYFARAVVDLKITGTPAQVSLVLCQNDRLPAWLDMVLN